MPASSIRELLAVRRISEWEFEAESYAEKQGNPADIAYGGCVLGGCVNAGGATVPEDLFIYSVAATYLGPTSTKELVRYKVRDVRTTRSFATRQIEAWQKQGKDGKDRMVMIMLADYHCDEPEIFNYNVHPREMPPDPETIINFRDQLEERLASGDINKKQLKAYDILFPLIDRYMDSRPTPSSIGAQNVYTLDAKRVTSQDHLKMTEKTNCAWLRSKVAMPSGPEKSAYAAFAYDAALAFLPLMFSHQGFGAAAAVSSLDVSLRFHTHQWRADDWLFGEQTTDAAGEGKTFSTARAWDRRGKLVLTMSQQSIMRARPDSNKSKL